MFKDILKGKVVILGVGNTLKADDGAGCILAQRLKGKTRIVSIDAGSAPENFTGTIKKEDPDTILIVDAADMGKDPGDFALLAKDDILSCGFTTHDLSPAMLMEYLQTQTRADIYMLGIQPQKVELGEGLSQAVEQALEKIEGFLTHA
jgi:hydrogenase 3 maturation protease